jgi:hypothetical protein
MQESQPDAASMREQAEKCRRLAEAVTDRVTMNALRDLARQLDAEAEEVEARALSSGYRPTIGE